MRAHVIRDGSEVTFQGTSIATNNVVDEADAPIERCEFHSVRFHDGTIQLSVRVPGGKTFHAVFENTKLVMHFALKLLDLTEGRSPEDLERAGRKALAEK